jgi:hypothetical protein
MSQSALKRQLCRSSVGSNRLRFFAVALTLFTYFGLRNYYFARFDGLLQTTVLELNQHKQHFPNIQHKALSEKTTSQSQLSPPKLHKYNPGGNRPQSQDELEVQRMQKWLEEKKKAKSGHGAPVDDDAVLVDTVVDDSRTDADKKVPDSQAVSSITKVIWPP